MCVVSQTHGVPEEHVETSELIKFGILALIVVVVALIARRGQAHSAPRAPQKPDRVTEGDADSAGDQRPIVAFQGTCRRRLPEEER